MVLDLSQKDPRFLNIAFPRCCRLAQRNPCLRVVSRRPGSIDFEPEPVLIGIVQFTPGIVQREIEFEPDTEDRNGVG